MTDNFAVSWSVLDYSNAISSHAGVLEAIRAGDPEGARQHMIEHLDRAESIHIAQAKQKAIPA
jgi:DNA-binding GntR family transcriptional regulator